MGGRKEKTPPYTQNHLWQSHRDSTLSIQANKQTVAGEDNGTQLQYSCLENPMDGGAWWAAIHGVIDGQTQLSDFTLTFHFHALEKEMVTHSSVLAWRIPGTGEPTGLPSMGSHSRTRLKWLSSSSSSSRQGSGVIHSRGWFPWNSSF